MWADRAECHEEGKKWFLPAFSASLDRDIGAKCIDFLGKVKQEEMGLNEESIFTNLVLSRWPVSTSQLRNFAVTKLVLAQDSITCANNGSNTLKFTLLLDLLWGGGGG